jgi:hypothetical protein
MVHSRHVLLHGGRMRILGKSSFQIIRKFHQATTSDVSMSSAHSKSSIFILVVESWRAGYQSVLSELIVHPFSKQHFSYMLLLVNVDGS